MRVDVNEFRLELKKLLGLNNGVLKIPIIFRLVKYRTEIRG